MKKINKKQSIFLLAGLCCLFSSCKELPPAEPFDPSNTRLHVVWSKSFYTDSSQAVMLAPIVTDRYVAVAGLSYGKSENHLVVFDKTNGERHPAWQNGASTETNSIARSFLIGGNNKDVLFCTTSESIHAFSIPTGQSLWTSIYQGNNSFFRGETTLFGADILAISPINNVCYVDKYNSTTGQKTNLFSSNEYINTVQWTVNEQNDTLFFFLVGGENACCYNLTKDSIVWKNNIFDDNNYSSSTSFHPIIVENKYVLFQHRYTVSCVDFSTGKLIWQQRIGMTDYCSIFYYEDKVIVHPDYGNMSCYDVKTGKLLWENTDLNNSYNRNVKMDIYKGNLYLLIERGGGYYPPSYLYCISLATGKVNWSDPGPDKGLYNNLTIDQQTGYLYCHSKQSVMCIDLNKTPKK